jgi:hypothetical protein
MDNHFPLSDIPALQILNHYLCSCGLSAVATKQQLWRKDDSLLMITLEQKTITILIDGHTLYEWPLSSVIHSWQVGRQELDSKSFWKQLSSDLLDVAKKLRV